MEHDQILLPLVASVDFFLKRELKYEAEKKRKRKAHYFFGHFFGLKTRIFASGSLSDRWLSNCGSNFQYQSNNPSATSQLSTPWVPT